MEKKNTMTAILVPYNLYFFNGKPYNKIKNGPNVLQNIKCFSWAILRFFIHQSFRLFVEEKLMYGADTFDEPFTMEIQ